MKVKKIDKNFSDILVIVPHSDDEILMTGGILYQAAALGNVAEVVMVTNGDCDCENNSKGITRLRESVAGLKVLGLDATALTILGYADTGMEKEESFLYQLYETKEGEKIYPSSCAKETYGLPELPEYHFCEYGQHGCYQRDTLVKDLREIILKKRPKHIFTTSCYDIHGDHLALDLFIRDILRDEKERGYAPKLYTGLVHSMAGDENWPLREGDYFTCPQGFLEQQELNWQERISFPLPEGMEQGIKREALLCHKVALEPNAVEFLMSFLKKEEIFWEVTY